jgi:hypothetical protein
MKNESKTTALTPGSFDRAIDTFSQPSGRVLDHEARKNPKSHAKRVGNILLASAVSVGLAGAFVKADTQEVNSQAKQGAAVYRTMKGNEHKPLGNGTVVNSENGGGTPENTPRVTNPQPEQVGETTPASTDQQTPTPIPPSPEAQ